MKPTKLGRAITLVKNSIAEEALWGETEAVDVKRRSPDKARPAAGAGFKGGATLEDLKLIVDKCRKCVLGKSRICAVFGSGSPKAALMFVGEGPGFDEDHKGEPFIGRAGQLLTKIIESIGLTREEVYIANIVKCHPMIDPSDPEKRGNDRPPAPEEVSSCLPYLDRQIELINPKVICTLGNSSAQTMLSTQIGISKLRGTFTEYKGIKMMPTYHPAALLRNPALKKEVWEDMKQIREALKTNN